MNWRTVLVLVAILQITKQKQQVRISDLAGCRELRLDGIQNNGTVYPISSFINNNPKDNEIFRMKFYVVGYDLYIYLMQDLEPDVYYRMYINGFKRRFCKVQWFRMSDDEKDDLLIENCQGLTNSFDYSELVLIYSEGI